ncbi:MAG: WG repeat-containing protein, partial [Firmicutes bacterium]|nr:WG repeat-containing protein [Bacillota bacterium]
MNKRILTLCLALILCLSLVPEQCFAVSAPKQAVIKEAPVAGVAAYNRGGLGLIEEKDGTFHLIDRDGGIYRSGKAWMDYMAGSGSYIVNGEGYYEYPLGRTMFTMPEMEKNVKAFLEEHYPMGEVVSVLSDITYPFSGPYATCSFSAAMKSDDQLEKYEFYALIDQNGLVHYMTPLIELTAGGGFPIETAMGSGSEGLVRFTREYNDREGGHYLYETGYLDLDGNEVLVFSNNDGRNPEDPAIVIDASDVAFVGDLYNGVAVICNSSLKESLIDRSGKVLLPFAHDSIYNDCGRYPVVYDEGKGYGYMDTAGLIVIPQQYEDAKGNWDDLFTVQKN